MSAHVLDPLSAAEIEAAAEVVRADSRFGERSRFVAISTGEPPRAEATNERRRRAEVLLHQRDERAVIRFVVDLDAASIESAASTPGPSPRSASTSWSASRSRCGPSRASSRR